MRSFCITENGRSSIDLRASRSRRCSAGASAASPSRNRCRDASSCFPLSRNTRGGAACACAVVRTNNNRAAKPVTEIRRMFLRFPNVVHDTRVEPRISIITLGVSDLERSLKFYRDGLGLPTTWARDKGVIFFQTTGVCLALYPLHELAKDAMIDPLAQRSAWTGIALAHNVRV